MVLLPLVIVGVLWHLAKLRADNSEHFEYFSKLHIVSETLKVVQLLQKLNQALNLLFIDLIFK